MLFGADAVWWSHPPGSAVTVLLTVIYYRYGGWRHAQMVKPARGQAATTGMDPPVVALDNMDAESR